MDRPCRNRHPDLTAGCHWCCLARTRQDYRDLWGIPGPAAPADPCAKETPAAPPRKPLCVYLGKRTEFRPGCGGWNCAHECGHDDPAKRAAHPEAVPGGNCQDCPDHEPDA